MLTDWKVEWLVGKLIVAGIGPGAANYVIPEVDHWVQQETLVVAPRLRVV